MLQALPESCNHKPCRIFHITGNHSPTNPGVTTVVNHITSYLVKNGWGSTVLAAGEALTPVFSGVNLVEFPLHPWVPVWRYPRGLATYLDQVGRNRSAVIHLHGVWGAAQWLAARAAARHGLALLLSAHDMISPWHWRDGRLRQIKKLVYWHTMLYPALRHLTMVHAITAQEQEHLGRLFPGRTICLIPNAIDLKEADEQLTQSDSQPEVMVKSPYLLFLGRLHQKKGVDLLIQAFARALKGRNFKLIIVGPDSTRAYTAFLKSLVSRLGLDQKVTFWGPAFGLEKWQLYRGAYTFCAPSHSEVVGMVNLEAAAARVPVITTYATGLIDWEEGGGLLTAPRVENLEKALDQVFSWGEEERRERGQCLRRLVEQRYSWEAVGHRWLELYNKMLELSR